ncbi:hypothetical protein [Actinacidiphila epipremni]|uniref:Integral membrane protein n=1 Tax=Actinacidiphila epipremni TaxID=2053013 RepID=A0ABX0ZEF2_9ACTN|nr:hypothetical protein [Actinacidiphila epipremni]NJP42070.1 hypothetical protein [Actinacidiphila epipremni]
MAHEGEARRQEPPGDGCVVIAVRIPVRVVTFAVVLPVRLVWDLLAAAVRACRTAWRWTWRRVLGPVLVFVWRYLVAAPVRALFRHVLVPLVERVLIPALRALWRWGVVPAVRGMAALGSAVWRGLVLLGRGAVLAGRGLAYLWRVLVVIPLTWLGRALAALWRVLAVLPAGWLWRRVVLPAARAGREVVLVLVGLLLVLPAVFLWRRVLLPLVRGIGAGFGLGGRAAGRALGWTWRWLVAAPVAFLWRRAVVPLARETWVALGFAWRGTAFVSRALGRALAWAARRLIAAPLVWAARVLVAAPVTWAARVLVAAPAAWAWRTAGAPTLRAIRATGRWYRKAVWQPVAEAASEARRTLRYVLLGNRPRTDRLPPPPKSATGYAAVPAPNADPEPGAGPVAARAEEPVGYDTEYGVPLPGSVPPGGEVR